MSAVTVGRIVATTAIALVVGMGVSSPSFADRGGSGKQSGTQQASSAKSSAKGGAQGSSTGVAKKASTRKATTSTSSWSGSGSSKGSTMRSTKSSSSKSWAKSTRSTKSTKSTKWTPTKSSGNSAGKGANNTDGPFDDGPGCTGAPSQNGSGGGGATGRPAAGCVGNADNKNPPGQSANDKNKGYECDENNGIGKSNPAHTSVCVPDVVNPPPPPNPPNPPKKTVVNPPLTPVVTPVTHRVVETEVITAMAPEKAETLPVTGSTLLPTLFAGMGLLAAGVVLQAGTAMRRRNRRNRWEPPTPVEMLH